jgi:hypothetical protein
MPPDVPQFDSATPAALPAVPIQGGPLPPIGPGSQPAPASGGSAGNAETAAVVMQAKQLVAQYAQDPFRLAAALQQQKETYLVQHFHISVNPTAEN